MKHITSILILLITAIGFSQNNPVNFEAGGEGATWTWTVFENDTNPPLVIEANPNPSGINTSATVAKFTALQLGQPFAGVESMHGADIGTFTLTNANALVKIMVYKTVISDVGIKFATAPGASTGELKVANTLINQWEELTFDFSSKIGEPTSTDIDQIVIFPDFIARPADDIIYFDNITFGAAPLPPTLPFDFEGVAPVFNDFNGSATQVIANPAPAGVNTSANVAENTVPANAAFAGVNIPVAVDISTDKGFTMQVWSPIPNTPVLLKLENSTTGVNVERAVNTTAASTWEDITFDFSTEGALTFNSVTVFMNFNMQDPNTQVYFWDNLEQISLAPPLPGLPLDFEGAPPTFGDFNGSATQVIANPAPGGANTSANVAENTVPANAAFAGVNIPVATIDISVDKLFTMNVWSPLPNTPILLKLENSTTGVNVERAVNTIAASTWEELTFDFSTEGALTFNSVTVFMNFNMVDPNTQVYFWDNLIQTSAPMGPFVPIDFEVGGNGADWTWTVFENDTNPPLQIIANPDPSGINTSPTVAEFTALQTGQPFAGVESMHGADIGTFTLDASNSTVTIMVWKPVISDVGIKFATLSGASTGEIKVANTLINQWEELTFDFSGVIGEPSSTDIDQIIIFPDFDARAMDNVVFFDNISFSPFVPVVTMLPLDFEGVAPIFNDFNGSATQVIPNPDPTGVNTSANVAENIVPANAGFAGVNIPVTYDIITDKFFRMDVWSTVPTTPVLLKLENSMTGVNVEREVSLTTTNAWEELIFDFSTEGALTFDSVTVFMNFNMVDANQQVYFWDNLELFTPIIPAPVNDLCADALPISCGEIVAGTTLDATDDSAVAPECDTTVTAPGVWYVYTDTSGLASEVTITMCNGTTDYDSKLSVYTGDCGAPPLTCVVGNDDTCGLQSEVTFQSDGATTFLILVHGFGANTGNFEIEMSCTLTPPANDMIANAIDIDELGCPYTDINVSMTAATTEAGNPMGCNIDGVNGVWYKGTPETNGEISATITTPAGNSFVNFYTAPDENATEADLVLVDWFDNQCAPSTSTNIPVVAGQTYYLFVANTGGATDVQIDCNLLGVDENNALAIDSYPNPITTVWNVQAQELITEISIYNVLGQQVLLTAPNTLNHTVDMSGWNAGIYLANVATQNGSQTIKLIKQ